MGLDSTRAASSQIPKNSWSILGNSCSKIKFYGGEEYEEFFLSYSFSQPPHPHLSILRNLFYGLLGLLGLYSHVYGGKE